MKFWRSSGRLGAFVCMHALMLLLFGNSTGISQRVSCLSLRSNLVGKAAIKWYVSQLSYRDACSAAIDLPRFLYSPWDATPPGFRFGSSYSANGWLDAGLLPQHFGPLRSDPFPPRGTLSAAVAWKPTCCSISTLPPSRLPFQEVKARLCQPITAKDIQLIKS